MKTRSLLLSAALALSIAAPLAASAQQAPLAPNAPTPGMNVRHHGHGFMRMLHGVNLSDQQKAQIKTLIASYHQTHPQGSQPDPQARKALHDQIMAVLTPAQQAQVKANIERMRDHRERHDTNATPLPQATP